MNAITYRQFGGTDVLVRSDSATPTMRPTELLVRVHTVSINPLDGKIRRGELRLMSGTQFPKTPGVDFAGVVEGVGAKVSGFAVGDRVFGFTGSMRQGTLAEVVAIPALAAAKLPRELDDEGAAAIALVGLAALQACRDVARVVPGERVLVHGASGGVGLMLIQLARQRSAHVTAVATGEGLAVARAFGADEVRDYRSDWSAELGGGFDVVFDVSTKLRFAGARKLLGVRGRYIDFEPSLQSLIGSALLNPFRRQKHRMLVARPSAEDLLELTTRIAERALVLPPVETFALTEVRRAFERVEHGGLIGKVVVRVQ